MRGANLHSCTNRRVKHPCRHDDRSARLSFDDDNLSSRPHLSVIAPHRTPVERVPPIVNLCFLPDMGRITLRLLSEGNPGYSADLTAEAGAPQTSIVSSSRPYAARGIRPFMPHGELCRTSSFSPGFAATGM